MRRTKLTGGNMPLRNILLVLGLTAVFTAPTRADEATVTWTDPSCGFFVAQISAVDPADSYGLYSWKASTGPQLGDMIKGDNFVAGEDVTATNSRNGDNYSLIHWANAKSPEMLIRNTPVQCRSKWKKKK